ncbi:hypothetical protein EGR_07762 [Echinococcus granulosus]|uniref:Uncharacterized protein n=1 Tax=Echinococcus granulosus TaxID=6210 RepID=W6UVA3_ECHGR|nr:hypothetical protein EGR_07762 [Echinococcus granulosus]EUB57369.1 hypothetical protein EGR_07762 [Echinococcus granulosus]
MKVFRKAKPPRKSKSPPPPRTLSELVDRLTTGGSKALSADLLSDLVSRIRESNSERDNALQLLLRQMQKPHAQIRCSVVKVLKFLTTVPSQSSLASSIQEAILLQLQDVLPYCIPTTSFDKALPPPESAAIEMQKEMLKMLLQWERGGVCSKLSSQARGQLASVMRYLRTPLEESGGTARLKDAASMLETLEREENQRRRKAQMADAVIRRRVLAARDAYREHYPLVVENVESLGNIVKLLVPDLSQMGNSIVSGSSSPRDFREHGFHTSGEVNITFSLNFTRVAGDSDLLLPEVQLTLNDDVQILREAGQEFTNVALKHRAILSQYLELSRIFADSPELSPIFMDDKDELESLLARLDKAVNQFSAVRFIEELPSTSTEAVEEEADDEDDFIEVPPLSLPSTHQTTSTAEMAEGTEMRNKGEERIPVKPLALLTDKLPWETEGRPSSSLSKQLQNPLRSGPARPLGRSKYSQELRREAPQESIILPSEETTPQERRIKLESLHRFWKPFDVAEFEKPQTDHLESVISFSSSIAKSLPVKVVDAEKFVESMRTEGVEEDQLSPSNSNSSQAVAKSLHCERITSKARWVHEADITFPPFDCLIYHGGGDGSAGDPIHCSFDHSVSGDRAARSMQSRACAAAQVVETVKQPLKRRRCRYPDLVDISRTEKVASRSLRHRLLHS